MLVGALEGLLSPPHQRHCDSTAAPLELHAQITKTLFAAALGNGELNDQSAGIRTYVCTYVTMMYMCRY